MDSKRLKLTILIILMTAYLGCEKYFLKKNKTLIDSSIFRNDHSKEDRNNLKILLLKYWRYELIKLCVYLIIYFLNYSILLINDIEIKDLEKNTVWIST